MSSAGRELLQIDLLNSFSMASLAHIPPSERRPPFIRPLEDEGKEDEGKEDTSGLERAIFSQVDLACFNESASRRELVQFIKLGATHVKGRPISSVAPEDMSEVGSFFAGRLGWVNNDHTGFSLTHDTHPHACTYALTTHLLQDEGMVVGTTHL